MATVEPLIFSVYTEPYRFHPFRLAQYFFGVIPASSATLSSHWLRLRVCRKRYGTYPSAISCCAPYILSVPFSTLTEIWAVLYSPFEPSVIPSFACIFSSRGRISAMRFRALLRSMTCCARIAPARSVVACLMKRLLVRVPIAPVERSTSLELTRILLRSAAPCSKVHIA